MRVIKSSDQVKYQKIFDQLKNKKLEIIVWQVRAEDSHREILEGNLTFFDLDLSKLSLKVGNKELLDPFLPLYCYVADGPLIFKTDFREVAEDHINANVPKELKVLRDPEVVDLGKSLGRDLGEVWKTKRLTVPAEDMGPGYMKVKSMAQRSSHDQDLLNEEFGLTLDEEDKAFAGKRESPRARPKDEKFVKLALSNEEMSETFRLFDLSRGGMGFITTKEEQFPKGTDITVLGFNDNDLDDPLIGTVMSIRPVDETSIEFKVGVKFNEGQD